MNSTDLTENILQNSVSFGNSDAKLLQHLIPSKVWL